MHTPLPMPAARALRYDAPTPPITLLLAGRWVGAMRGDGDPAAFSLLQGASRDGRPDGCILFIARRRAMARVSVLDASPSAFALLTRPYYDPGCDGDVTTLLEGRVGNGRLQGTWVTRELSSSRVRTGEFVAGRPAR